MRGNDKLFWFWLGFGCALLGMWAEGLIRASM